MSRPSLEGCRVLIIDDHEPNRLLLAALINTLGIVNIAFAADGVEGLEQVEKTSPDLVLLDIMMPNMDGFEMCRRLRADDRWKNLPVLVNTAMNEPKERVECFKAGATDMVAKPINGPEVLARVRIHLENRLLLDQLQAYRERVAFELSVAADMQRAIQPSKESLAQLGGAFGLSIWDYFEPSSELGGDLYEMMDLGGGRAGILMADFSGHGVTAAINAFRLHTLLSGQSIAAADPAAWMKGLNRTLQPLLPMGQFATALFAIIDTEAGTLRYAASGAPSPILITPGKEASLLDGSGYFLGALAEAEFENREAPFPKGSHLLLYSDALSESQDAESCAWDEAGVLQEALACLDQPRPLEALVAKFEARVPRPFPDDLSLLWIAHTGR
jgi:sigma-B regulation protein RsbU (phosphoserine phosphatase)